MVIPHFSSLIPKGASRREDSRLVTGQGRYTSDWNLPGQLHAAVLRADRAHADIVRMDATRALAHPGVKAVLTGEDARAAGFKSLPNIVGYPGKDGQQIRKPHHPVLALGRVRFVGEAVAMVVADTAAIAEDARELIEVEYRDLPAVASFDAAVATGAPQLHADVPGNLAFEYESGDAPAVAAAFARAKYVSKLTMDSQRLVGNMLEPRACLVAFEPESGRYTFYLPLQGLGGMRGQLSHVSGVGADKIMIGTQDVGGSFGVRGPAYPEYFAAMIAAKKLGRPVKWVGTRGESFMSDFQGRALSLTGEIALDADGTFLAIRFDDRADLGAYGGAFGAFIATRNLTVTLGGVYRVAALYGRARLAYTNTAPVSAYRGAGRPDIAYAIERLVDYAAHEHGFDPIALRRRNFIPRSAMPYKTPNAGTYDSGDFEAVMDDALERADWSGFPKRRAHAIHAGKLRGIGIATYLEAGGGGATPKDQVAVAFDRNGCMTLYAVTHSSGQGHETTFPQIVAGVLGLSTAYVRFHPRPPAADLVGNGTGGSRGVLGTGSAFHVLGAKLIELARPHAATALKTPGSELRYAKGKFHAGRRAIGFIELARKLAGAQPHPFDTTAEGTYGISYPNGCHIAEVEIDPETGAAEIARYVAVDDLGNVVNHMLVEGQVHGGVVQGAGQVFGEHAVYDSATAQLLTGSFMDYVMPRAGWLRHIEVHDHPVPTPTNALGAKGVGESGCSGSIPALANAAMNALRPLGITHLDMPLTPARLWAVIRQARARGNMATIKLFVSNSMRGVMSELIPQFERASGHLVSISYDPAKVMMERIARGETADLAILGGSAIEDLIRTGKVAAGSKRTIASCGVGVAVLAGASKPDIGSLEAFKKALLAAKSVAWTQEGASGMYFTKLIERLGIAEPMKAKAVRRPGGLIGELVAARKAELAIQQIPELMAVPGIELAGPLPPEIQVTTVSVAGVFAGSSEPDAARALLDFLTTPAAARVFKAKGMEPA